MVEQNTQILDLKLATYKTGALINFHFTVNDDLNNQGKPKKGATYVL